MECSPPARLLYPCDSPDKNTIFSSRGSFPPRDGTSLSYLSYNESRFLSLSHPGSPTLNTKHRQFCQFTSVKLVGGEDFKSITNLPLETTRNSRAK